MDKIRNNFKQIREIYGVTQDEISKIVGVNRATISQWETGTTRASSANLEKLSIFYGVGPETFYELEEIDETRRYMIIESSKHAKEIEEQSHGERNKVDDLKEIFESISFSESRRNFMMAMKILLASADHAETLDDLQLAYDITIKMAKRLNAIIDIRREEEKAKRENNEETLFDLLDKFN
ncbi:helix-turn-helix transcriptional regulator [Ruminiclostridium papyrosolvens]|jgi:transcriptional regulator with XRE-family HTH domain|uniref:HTH cro/C1-type domain-containing protein n=1 Tax=Ruminiclostridium papyrosolvens C7 TaxID=1330534 RepID=U4QYQ6_9FIRM|nr:helix-turn-helix transcriptional regulator [Ruminiclostridium papyrosolvens]EPR09965.1 hypothetical protein L323_15445 [Ruminiclostridium papyrosolvens C7]